MAGPRMGMGGMGGARMGGMTGPRMGGTGAFGGARMGAMGGGRMGGMSAAQSLRGGGMGAAGGLRGGNKDKWGVVVGNYKDLYGNVQDDTDQLRALEKAVKDKPDNPALRFLAGFHYAYLGFPKEAVDQLDKVLKVQPQDEMAKALRDELRAKLPKPIAPPAAPPTPPAPSAWIMPKTMAAARAA